MTTPDSSTPSNTAEVGFATVSSPPELPTAALEEDQPVLAPARADERISALDTIRGFALLGILLMNICGFGLPSPLITLPSQPAGQAA